MDILIGPAVILGVGLFIGTSLHYGGKWVDGMLRYDPAPDPNKPIVLPHIQDRCKSAAR